MGGRLRGCCSVALAWAAAQVLPLGVLFGDFRRHFDHEGFQLDRQLGRGRTSEAWLARRAGGDDNRSLVLKIRSRGFKFPDLIAFSIGHSGQLECGISRMLSEHFSAHFLNCSAAGIVDVGAFQLEFVAYDLAPGQALDKLVAGHSLAQRPPPELASLAAAIDVFLRVFQAVDECVRPRAAGRPRFYLPDLQIGNVLLAPGGKMTLIDYDRIELCCEVPGCSEGAPACDAEVDASWLFILQQRLLMILLQLLIGIEPSRTRYFIHFEARVFRAWQITACRSLIKKGYHGPRPNLTDVVEVITSQIFPGYRDDWSRLQNGTGLLGQAYMEAHDVEPPWPPGFIASLRHQRASLS